MEEKVNKQPPGLPCGIYFGLSEEKYRKDSALNYSGMKQLLEGPEFFWEHSSMNPNWKPSKRTEQMKVGTILHTLLLEPKEFSNRCFVYPGEPYCTDRMMVRRDDYINMQHMVKVVSELPDLENLITHGAAETVIIWEDPRTGIRMKAKHDYWKPYCSVDYKTAYGINESAIKSAFYRYAYHIQAYHYKESRLQIRRMLLEDAADVYGKIDMRLIDRFLAGEGPNGGRYMDNFVFIFQMKDPPFSARVFEPSEYTFMLGLQDAQRCASAYAANLKEYGTNRWMGNYGDIEEFDMQHGFNRG